MMNMNDYQLSAMRTANGMDKRYPMILNGVLGLNGESGECADIVKKHLLQGHDLDEIAQMNVDKLYKRYPNGFDSERSVNRDDAS